MNCEGVITTKEMCLEKYNGQYPVKMAKRKEVLTELVSLFNPDEVYQEQKVTEIISKFFPGDQYCEIRRDMIGLGFMERNAADQTYWVSEKNCEIQKQWDDAAEAWVDFVRTGMDYFRDEMNNPAMFEVLGDIDGEKILDMACGEGYNSRIMAKKGADVTGVDFSKKMIELAVQEENRKKPEIDYHVADATDLHIFKDDSFDIVTSFLALQDIEDYQSAIKEASRILKKRGRFVFVITHPCFEARTIGDKQVAGWMYESGLKKKAKEVSAYLKPEETALYFMVDRYFETHSDVIQWKMERLTKQFETTAFHRTLTDYANAINDAGLLISGLKEPKPTKRGIEKYPIMKEILRIPHSIVFETVKC